MLRNAEVQKHIRARLQDAEIDAREILWTLASHMRALEEKTLKWIFMSV